MTDDQGIRKAYDDPNNIVFNGNHVYVSGTHLNNPQDLLTDLTIPLGMIKYTDRYKQLEQLMDLHPEAERMIGHSMGGSLILAYQQNHPERYVKTYTYGAPVISLTEQPKVIGYRFRNKYDPISSLDLGATVSNKNVIHEPYSYNGIYY
jgi:pimeloyl-ACP methyl ester carboxylesterase